MSKTEDQQKNNAIINEIFLDIAELAYFAMEPEGGADFKAVIEFDHSQRVKSIENLSINNKSQIPSTDDITAINEKASKILTLPDIYLIKNLNIEIKNGEAVTVPTYLQ